MSLNRIADAPFGTFLVAADVPPNLLRLKPGEKLRWKGVPRYVVRVGYRKTARDFLRRAQILLDTEEGKKASWQLASLRRDICLSKERLAALDLIPLPDPQPLPPALRLRGLDWVVARALAAEAHLGGPDRGILVGVWPSAGLPETVRSIRTVRLGRYYPPAGGGEDAEPGGLDRPRTVLVNLGVCEALSGDLERV